MSKAAKSVAVFGGYLAVLGVWLLLHPNSLLRLFGVPDVVDVWIRVLGMILVLLSVYYVLAARAGLTEFLRWTVYTRASVILFFGAFVLTELAPPVLLVFGIVDLGAALWTSACLRADVRGT